MKRRYISCMNVLAVFCLSFIPMMSSSAENSDILVGVIRWAGWGPNNHHEKYLSKKQWHYRVPFFAKIEGDKVTMNEEVQDVMDKEILFASKAGIDYWSLNYRAWPRNPPPDFKWGRSRVHELHLASPHKDKIKFCLMLQDSMLGPSRDKHPEIAKKYDYVKEWDTTASEFVEIFKKTAYQKVLTNRPLIYVFGAAKFGYFENPSDMKKGLDLLARKSKAAGLGKPYIVAMTWLGSEGGKWFNKVGYDAVSGYAAPIHPKISRKTFSGHAYCMLAEANQIYWQACQKTGRQVVPVVNEGWDARPHYVNIDKNYDRPKGAWFQRGTDTEVARNVKAACNWVRSNPESCETRSILLYAWNEFAEGGWLCPTVKDGNKRLQAVAKVLQND